MSDRAAIDIEKHLRARAAELRQAISMPGDHQEIGVEVSYRGAAVAYQKAADELEQEVTGEIDQRATRGELAADFGRALEAAAARGAAGEDGIGRAVAALLSIQARRTAAYLRSRARDLCEEAALKEGAAEEVDRLIAELFPEVEQ